MTLPGGRTLISPISRTAKKMEFSVFLADVRPSSSSKKLSLGAAQTFSGYEEAGVHHIEENPTRLCMPSHWTGETDSPEVELSKRDRSNAPTLYCLFGGGRKRLWDHSTFIAFQSYSDLARLEYETKVILKYARSFFPTYPNRTFDYLVERKADSLGGISRGKKENTYTDSKAKEESYSTKAKSKLKNSRFNLKFRIERTTM